ncbi:hypothetical protein V6N13_015351 [Hibiscus sabdariffa]|uniref:Uncharacterized protein n=1 Tax=Hibiscus sabdariffa TaxID=183260 RepID=A0ABR2CVV0_9ROSI
MGWLFFDFPSLPALTLVDNRGLSSPSEATLVEPEKQAVRKLVKTDIGKVVLVPAAGEEGGGKRIQSGKFMDPGLMELLSGLVFDVSGKISYLVRTREASEETCKDSHGKLGFSLQKSERFNSVLCFCKRKAVGVFAMLLENHFAGGLLYISRVVAGNWRGRRQEEYKSGKCMNPVLMKKLSGLVFFFFRCLVLSRKESPVGVLIRGQQVKLKISN